MCRRPHAPLHGHLRRDTQFLFGWLGREDVGDDASVTRRRRTHPCPQQRRFDRADVVRHDNVVAARHGLDDDFSVADAVVRIEVEDAVVDALVEPRLKTVDGGVAAGVAAIGTIGETQLFSQPVSRGPGGIRAEPTPLRGGPPHAQFAACVCEPLLPQPFRLQAFPAQRLRRPGFRDDERAMRELAQRRPEHPCLPDARHVRVECQTGKHRRAARWGVLAPSQSATLAKRPVPTPRPGQQQR